MKYGIVGTAVGWALALGLAATTLQAAAAETIGIGEDVQKALKEAGWQVEQLADGSVELRLVSAVPEDGPANTSGAVSQDSAALDRLRESGWRVERTSDGSTLLFPPAIENDMSAEATTDIESPEPGPAKSLDDYLQERGWRVERSADGALLLHPQTSEARDTAKAVVEPSAGMLPAAVRNAEIELPVDRWEEARAIAESWLKSAAIPELSVGEIRQIFRVYLVSIVDVNPPQRLRHQLAIRTTDGRVIVLN